MKKKLLILYASVGIIILVCLICMTLNRKKQNQTEPVSTELNTDVTTESVSEMSTEQDNSESESENITLSEDNYIETIKQIISGQTNSQTPVTKACLASFDSADLSGIISSLF